jgi:hypothetical protein
VSRTQVAFIRTATIYLVLTGGLGVAMMIEPAWTGILRIAHTHAGFLGFFLSFVMGVAFWLMPRPGGERTPRLEAVTFVTYHGGLALRMIADPIARATGAGWAGPVTIVAGTTTLIGMIVFAASMWRRARSAETLRRLRTEPDRRG